MIKTLSLVLIFLNVLIYRVASEDRLIKSFRRATGTIKNDACEAVSILTFIKVYQPRGIQQDNAERKVECDNHRKHLGRIAASRQIPNRPRHQGRRHAAIQVVKCLSREVCTKYSEVRHQSDRNCLTADQQMGVCRTRPAHMNAGETQPPKSYILHNGYWSNGMGSTTTSSTTTTTTTTATTTITTTTVKAVKNAANKFSEAVQIFRAVNGRQPADWQRGGSSSRDHWQPNLRPAATTSRTMCRQPQQQCVPLDQCPSERQIHIEFTNDKKFCTLDYEEGICCLNSQSQYPLSPHGSFDSALTFPMLINPDSQGIVNGNPRGHFNINPQENFNNKPQESFKREPHENFHSSSQEPFNSGPQEHLHRNPLDHPHWVQQEQSNRNLQAHFPSKQQDHSNIYPLEHFHNKQQDNFQRVPRENFHSDPQENFHSSLQESFNSGPQEHFQNKPQEHLQINPLDHPHWVQEEQSNINPQEHLQNKQQDHFNVYPLDHFESIHQDNLYRVPREHPQIVQQEDLNINQREHYDSNQRSTIGAPPGIHGPGRSFGTHIRSGFDNNKPPNSQETGHHSIFCHDQKTCVRTEECNDAVPTALSACVTTSGNFGVCCAQKKPIFSPAREHTRTAFGQSRERQHHDVIVDTQVAFPSAELTSRESEQLNRAEAEHSRESGGYVSILCPPPETCVSLVVEASCAGSTVTTILIDDNYYCFTSSGEKGKCCPDTNLQPQDTSQTLGRSVRQPADPDQPFGGDILLAVNTDDRTQLRGNQQLSRATRNASVFPAAFVITPQHHDNADHNSSALAVPDSGSASNDAAEAVHLLSQCSTHQVCTYPPNRCTVAPGTSTNEERQKCPHRDGVGVCCAKSSTVAESGGVECGHVSDSRPYGPVPGADQVLANQVPWLAVIMDTNTNHLCYGSLISHKHVLTTDTCVAKAKASGGAIIRIGLHSAEAHNNGQSTYQQRHAFIYSQVHVEQIYEEHWNAPAVIVLDKPVAFNTQTGAICLQKTQTKIEINDQCFSVLSGNRGSDSMRHLVPTKHRYKTTILDDCRKHLYNPNSPYAIVTDKSICTLRINDTASQCQKSQKSEGYGLFCLREGRYILAGLGVSEPQCFNNRKIFLDVTRFYNFFKSILDTV